MSSSALRLLDALRVGTLLGALGLSFVLHRRAGLTLPIPWIDEATFLWPARSLSEHLTLLAPELNPDRPVMWMPPGYTVAMALAFRFTGLSLVVARWLSWMFTAGALAGLFLAHRVQRSSPWSLAFLFAISLMPSWVVAGNTARMEALVLLIAASGFALLAANRPWVGLAVLGLGPLVHPNGAFLALGGIAAVAQRWRLRRLRSPGRWEYAALGAAAACWLGYAILVAVHRDAFVRDMAYQWARKAAMERSAGWSSPRALALPLAAAGLATISWRLHGEARATAFLAISAGLVGLVSNEMWYGVYADLSLVLVIAEALDVAAAWTAGHGQLTRLAAAVALLASTAAGLRALRYIGVTETPRYLPDGMAWECTAMQPRAYADEAELAALRAVLHRVAAPGARVAFEPPGDALLIADDRTLAPFTPVFTETAADVLVVHLTPELRACAPELDAQVARRRATGQPLAELEPAPDRRWTVFAAR